jgi:hypothetical protein
MAARQKLNQAYFLGSALVAGLVGYATQSWTVFGIVLALLVLSSLHAGEIRPGPRRGR